ncbi:SusD/RagB family nutrient-binding outer membrane lipoprotein [Allomuricauda sp. SCSIO 65647]|uniref:SusD/RagB family nutrient-binding outer membrane lipoprotein n=1 Tax=Allomuricauda sp. SCSIO 65647 TaxID=2908843 RepID=UPI001F2FB5F5|nr:SusD/RagB family nutrient-binding outer membrane lipoprotein [Muricauda sp. SCSIO 65647]UJH66498.1 SusD/RagB family nutrient-binding outer membrane lipoprotein [Muricauda sp. SCSIO 65647]
MKNRFKTIGLAFVASSMLLTNGCETTGLEVVPSPNFLNPEQADVDFFLNSIQQLVAKLHSGTEGRAENGWAQFGMEAVRIQHQFGPTYRESYEPSDFDQIWDDAYSEALIDIRTMNPLAEEAGQFTHLAIGQILEAYIITTLVDLFGDVPYTEAVLGNEGVLNPALDTGASIYAAADQLLVDAIANLNRSELSLPTNDIYYGGDESQWVKAANTMRLRLAIQSRLANPAESTSIINSLVAGGNLILDFADDMQFQWGTNNAAPDSRHPYFDQNYDGQGPSSDFYTCNYYMDLMANQYGDVDPRIRYYFYRQQSDFSGADVITKECVTEITIPAWWADFNTYCLVPNVNGYNGLWGRNHLDDDGIPPDDAFRTLHGLYPIGGPFDDDSFRNVAGSAAVSEGLAGGGISPIFLASNTNLMLAEAALVLGTTGNARTYLENGIRQSMNKVAAFGAVLAAGSGFEATPALIDSHVAEILTAFDAGDDTDKLRIIAEQLFIADWCNGMDAYNAYRRTGQPDNLTPATRVQDPGTFQRSMWYPQVAADNNINITQKTNPDTPVFWDTNPEGFVD